MSDNNKEKKKINKWLITILLLLLLLIGAVLAIFLPGIINGNKEDTKYVSSYTVNLINDSSSLDTDKSFTLHLTNEVLNKEESLRFSSTDNNVGVGPYLTKPYIFEDRGGVNSNVKIEFTISDLTIKEIKYEISVSDIDGNNITILDESSYTLENNSVTYVSTSDIFINKVVVTYSIK